MKYTISSRWLRRRSGALAALALAFVACDRAPVDPVAEAQLLLEEQRVTEAIALLERSLDASPDDTALNRFYGATLLALGEASQAIWPLGKVTTAPNAVPEDWLILATAHLRGGSPSDAINVVDEMLEEAPDILEAYQLRIEANKSLGRSEQALADVDYLLSLRPDDASILIDRAGLLLDLERPDEALVAIEAARSHMDSPEAPEAWTARFCAVGATLAFERGEAGYVERAREAWEGCLGAHPADSLVVTEATSFFDGQREPERSLEILRTAVEESPETPTFRILLAQRLAAGGAFEEAEAHLLEAVGTPEGGGARPTLIEFYSARGDYDNARAAIEEWMALMPDVPTSVRILHADILIRGGEFGAAEEAIETLEGDEYQNLLLGRLALEQGDPVRALELLEEGIQFWPSNAVARILMSEAAEQTGDFERAITEYIEALRNDPGNWEALSELARLVEPTRRPGPLGQLLSRYLSENPSDPRGYRLKFEVGVWSGNEEFVQAALRALQSLPGQAVTAVALTAEARGRRDPAAAITFIESRGRDLTAPGGASILDVLVENLLALSQHDAALARADAAIAAHPEVAAFHELRGRSLAATGASRDDARAAFERAVELVPDQRAAWLGLGRLAAEQGNVDVALAAFDRAAAADAADPTAEWDAIQALAAAGRDDEIGARLATLLAFHLQHAGANELLARRSLATDLEAAQRAGERAVRLRGGPSALATLGSIYRRQGNTEGALPLLQRAVELEPESPSFRYELGVALSRAGDADAARKELEKALAGEGFAEAEQARAELAQLGT